MLETGAFLLQDRFYEGEVDMGGVYIRKCWTGYRKL